MVQDYVYIIHYPASFFTPLKDEYICVLIWDIFK